MNSYQLHIIHSKRTQSRYVWMVSFFHSIKFNLIQKLSPSANETNNKKNIHNICWLLMLMELHDYYNVGRGKKKLILIMAASMQCFNRPACRRFVH